MSENDPSPAPLPAALGVALTICVALLLASPAWPAPRARGATRRATRWTPGSSATAQAPPARRRPTGASSCGRTTGAGTGTSTRTTSRRRRRAPCASRRVTRPTPWWPCGQVYWVDRSGYAPVVWTLDPESDEAVPVSGAGADQVAAGERWVVWSEATVEGRDIVALDRESGATFVVCAAGGDQIHPAASDGLIVWEDYRGDGRRHLCLGPLRRGGVPRERRRGRTRPTPSVYGTRRAVGRPPLRRQGHLWLGRRATCGSTGPRRAGSRVAGARPASSSSW